MITKEITNRYQAVTPTVPRLPGWGEQTLQEQTDNRCLSHVFMHAKLTKI